MAQKGKKVQVVIIFLIFIIYFLAAARPIPRETILSPKWISSLESGSEKNGSLEEGVFSGQLLPFTLGSRFGYVDESGKFAINRIRGNDIYLSQNMWTEYTAEGANIEIKNVFEETIVNIENAGGYPILLDDRVFILGSEQNALSEIGKNGNVLWTYEFGAPLTCIDAAAGLVLTGSIDGAVEILNSGGERIFYFEPGGSRYAVILGCALSSNGSRIGVISGIDQQRFLLLERFGNSGGEYMTVYNEYVGTGFRRPVRISFIDEDRRVVFEHFWGIGCYSIRARRTVFIPLDGEIAAIDELGDKGVFFLITSHSPQRKDLVGIRFPNEGVFSPSKFASAPNAIFLRASFKSDDVFLGRTGSMLVAGGGAALVSFNLEEK